MSDWLTLTASSSVGGSLANWASKASLQPVADTILQEACSWIFRRLRHWRMLTGPTSVVFALGQDTMLFPTGFLEPDEFWYINLGTPYFLTQKDPNQVYRSWQYDGTGARVRQPPTIYSFNGLQVQLDSPPDKNYAGFMTYYQQPAALSVSNPTNFLTDTYPRLLRVACMAGACEWAKDNGQGNIDRTYWDQLAMDEIAIAQAESDRARRATINAAQMIGGSGTGSNGLWGW